MNVQEVNIMDFLKSLFENGAITWEQFQQGVEANGYKIADLSKGAYVAKHKYDDDIASRDATITELNGQITQRDTDIAGLKDKLENSSADNKTKVEDLNNQLAQLQTDYAKEKSDYEAKLSHQAYSFAVKEFANTKKFSSKAAQRDFINEMMSANLQMKDNTILGADDFVKLYQEQNSDAFITEEPPKDPDSREEPKPTFVQPTPPAPSGDDNPFMTAFNFPGLRPHNDNK